MTSLFIGKNIIELKSTSSTNTYLKEALAKDQLVEGTAVYAHTQTAGRGQQGNSWLSESNKNLTLSYVLYPKFLEADKQFYLNMVVCLAVKDFCEQILGDEIKIKWPNDIYYGNEKLGGILIENSISGSRISQSVIGIGINVNQTEFNAELPNPTSLSNISSKEFSVEQLIEPLSTFLEKYYLQLRQLHFNFLSKAYTEALYRYQQTHTFRKGSQLFRGEINGVAKEGKLIIHSNGREQKFAFKEVEYVI